MKSLQCILISGFNQDDGRFNMQIAVYSLCPNPEEKTAKFILLGRSRSHRTINKFNKKENLNLFESIKTFQLRFGSFEWVDLGKQLREEEERGNFYYIFSLNETHSSDFTPHAVGVEMNIKKFSSIHFERMFIVVFCLSVLSININSPRIFRPRSFPILDSILLLSRAFEARKFSWLGAASSSFSVLSISKSKPECHRKKDKFRLTNWVY